MGGPRWGRSSAESGDSRGQQGTTNLEVSGRFAAIHLVRQTAGVGFRCDDLVGGCGLGLTCSFLAWCLRGVLSTRRRGHLRQCQPSERDRTGAGAARLVAVLSALGRQEPSALSGRQTASPPSRRRSRSGHGRVDPTAMSMSPRPPANSAATWPRRGSRPRRGYRGLLDWARGLGRGSVGADTTRLLWAGLACFLGAPGQVVVEVNRPDRHARRRGTSDPVDAEAAARAVVAGQATAIPRPVTAWSRCAVPASGQRHGDHGPPPGRQCAAGAAGHRPVELHEQLRGLDPEQACRHGGAARPGRSCRRPRRPASAGHRGRAAVGAHRRAHHLDAELDRPTARAAPAVRELCGVGAEVAGALLVTAGDGPAGGAGMRPSRCGAGPPRSRPVRADRAAPPEPRR